jgi:hypothetical protein
MLGASSTTRSPESNVRADPWLVSRRFDLAIFLAPALVALGLVTLGPTLAPDGELPLPGWVVAVLLVDVAHVWATLPRTYLDPAARARWPTAFVLVPALGWVLGVLLHARGPKPFWTALAYLAAWHFVRQQVGWVALYHRKAGDTLTSTWRRLDRAATYLASLGPLVAWHLSPPRAFAWFVPGDFRLASDLPLLAEVAPTLARAVGVGGPALVAAWAVARSVDAARSGRWPVGVLVVVLTTAACWSVGIVATDDDWSFTWTNTLIHGVPYLAIVARWSGMGVREAVGLSASTVGSGGMGSSASSGEGTQPARALAGLVPLVVGLAFVEELLWDRLVWHDHGALFPGPALTPSARAQALLVPLLALPQVTHYVLDAFIWRTQPRPGDAPTTPRAHEAVRSTSTSQASLFK